MKNLLNLGKALNKAEQKKVFGGAENNLTKAKQQACQLHSECYAHIGPGGRCVNGYCA